VAVGLGGQNVRSRETRHTTSDTKVVCCSKDHEIADEGVDGVVFLLDLRIRVTGENTRNARVRRTASVFGFAPVCT